MCLLKIENLGVSYGGMHALNDISIDINEKEVVGILGANGAGKSTLMNTISGLLTLDHGKIEFNGVDVTRLQPHEIVELGIIQIPEGRKLFQLLTVEENLFIGSYVRRARVHRKQSLELVYDILPRLKERRTQLAKTLSGGEQQMLAIGRGLMAEPKLLMMDEPTLGLSPKLVGEVFQIIEGIRERGMAIILSEQNVVKTLKIADRAYVIENGIVTKTGVGTELLGDEHIKKAFIGM